MCLPNHLIMIWQSPQCVGIIFRQFLASFLFWTFRTCVSRHIFALAAQLSNHHWSTIPVAAHACSFTKHADDSKMSLPSSRSCQWHSSQQSHPSPHRPPLISWFHYVFQPQKTLRLCLVWAEDQYVCSVRTSSARVQATSAKWLAKFTWGPPSQETWVVCVWKWASSGGSSDSLSIRGDGCLRQGCLLQSWWISLRLTGMQSV